MNHPRTRNLVGIGIGTLCLYGIGAWWLSPPSRLSLGPEKSNQFTKAIITDQLPISRSHPLIHPVSTKAALASHSESAQRKIQILDEVFKSKNDNDPRLDQELKNLSVEDKVALIDKYNELKSELRNERGTIVFLIGRNLRDPEDFEFLGKVLHETPCLSLQDCSKRVSEGDSDFSAQNELTLEYPQIIALTMIRRHLQDQPTSPYLDKIQRQLAHIIATKTYSARVRTMATEIKSRLLSPTHS